MSLDVATKHAVERGLTRFFYLGTEDATPFWPNLCIDVPSEGEDEEYGILGAVPSVREWIDDREQDELRSAKFTLGNIQWEITLPIKKTKVKDDRVGAFSYALQDMGKRFMNHPDKKLMDLVVNAASTECFDGQYFFDTDHVWGDSGTQSNDLTYECTDATEPTAAECKKAFNQATFALADFKDDKGEYLNGEIFGDPANQMLVLCHGTNYQPMLDALTVRLGATGGDNVVIIKAPRIERAARMPASTFDIYRTDGPLMPFMFQRREAISTGMERWDDRMSKNVYYCADARYNLGYFAWWKAVRTTLTTA